MMPSSSTSGSRNGSTFATRHAPTGLRKGRRLMRSCDRRRPGRFREARGRNPFSWTRLWESANHPIPENSQADCGSCEIAKYVSDNRWAATVRPAMNIGTRSRTIRIQLESPPSGYRGTLPPRQVALLLLISSLGSGSLNPSPPPNSSPRTVFRPEGLLSISRRQYLGRHPRCRRRS